jgi:hypothetical protein
MKVFLRWLFDVAIASILFAAIFYFGKYCGRAEESARPHPCSLSLNWFDGVDPTGLTDSTTGIQSALDVSARAGAEGIPVTLLGYGATYKVSDVGD